MPIFEKEEIPPLCCECHELMEKKEIFTGIFGSECPNCRERNAMKAESYRKIKEELKKIYPAEKYIKLRINEKTRIVLYLR